MGPLAWKRGDDGNTDSTPLGKPYTREQCVSILTQMWDNVQSDVSIFPMSKASCLSAEHTRAFSINCDDLQDEGNQSNIQAISLGSLKTQTWNVAFAMRGTANNPSEAGEKDWNAYSRKMQQVEVIWAREKMGSISCMDKVHPPLHVCKCCCNDALQVPTGSKMSQNPAAVPVCAIYTCLTSQLGMRICCISQNKEGLAHCLPLMILWSFQCPLPIPMYTPLDEWVSLMD